MNQPSLKTINFRGKEYNLVESRIAIFNHNHPRGAQSRYGVERQRCGGISWDQARIGTALDVEDEG